MDTPCATCSDGWYKGEPPRLLGDNIDTGLRVYRCSVCGQYWIETDRFAKPVSERDALDAVPGLKGIE